MALECRHIKPGGRKCRASALRNMPYCYFHNKQHRLSTNRGRPKEADEPIDIPILEDRSAVQIAVSQVLSAISSARLDPKRAGLLLYGLQIASQNAKEDLEIVSLDTVETMTFAEDGEELGPEEWDCDPEEDCCDCDQWENCENPERECEEEGEEEGDEGEQAEEEEEETGSRSPHPGLDALCREARRRVETKEFQEHLRATGLRPLPT